MLASPKRGAEEREALHGWFPYYAGFSSAFVRDVIDHSRLNETQVVLDPMNGSGTTTMVADEAGVKGVGFDLNPAAVGVARAKNAALAGTEIQPFVEEVLRGAQRKATASTPHEDALKWVSDEAYRALKQIQSAIKAVPAPIIPLAKPLKAIVEPLPGYVPPSARDILWGALLVATRTVSSAQQSKNPTWIRPEGENGATAEDVYQSFAATAKRLADDLTDYYASIKGVADTISLQADARLRSGAAFADVIITSPPYLTRIDYAVSTAPELVILGYESAQDLKAIRREIMGSTCITGGSYEIRNEWGRACLSLLETVKNHGSKASATYYFKNHLQYFRDAFEIVRTSLSLLKDGCSAYFVVQDSWYKDVPILLGKIYAEMAISLGADASVLMSETVNSHIGLVNRGAKAYEKGAISEHVVLMNKR